LLANLVHELGRPLGAMRAAIRALGEGASNDPSLRTNLLSGMDLQTRGLERLVQDLTRLYDSSAGGLPMRPERTDLNPWLQDTLRPWQAAAEQKGIVWETFLEPLPTLWIDPLRLGQALSNLLSNAVKFTSPGGQVRVVAQPSGDQVRLSVEDTGPGLTPEDREHLFTPFYRARHATRFPQGMGLGLAIARQLVLAHGGSIEFDSAPGKGSRFTIRLPMTPQPPSPAI
jgi:signal transduction histidine kinase